MADLGTYDLAVVGAGAAGLWSALRAAEAGGSVVLISRKPLAESASFHAQGGLAAALEPDDSPEQHFADTIAAGRNLCRNSAVEVLTEAAPGVVHELINRGVNFDRTANGSPILPPAPKPVGQSRDATRAHRPTNKPTRRGPAAEAQACYAETAQSAERTARNREQRRLAAMLRPPPDHRPDKRERRQLEQLRRRQG